MKYARVETVLPDNLIKEIQKYIQGGYLYIPCQPGIRKKWGENSGSRSHIKKRNESIRIKHKDGYKVEELAEEFFLSVASIKKIIYVGK